MVTNIQIAAEARQVQWRTEIDNARRIRLELLEDYNISSQDQIDEITKGWLTAKEKVIPQEVQAALIHQQQLCADLIKDKHKVIDAIQQELKASDDRFVADIKKQTVELQLMMEKMEEQDNTLTQAYREELDQWMESVQKEEKNIRTEAMSVWDQSMKKLLETEVDKLSKRQQAVEKYGAQIHDLMFQASDRFNTLRNKEFAEFQKLKLEIHQVLSEQVFIKQKILKETKEAEKLKAENNKLKAKMIRLDSEMKKLCVYELNGKKRKENQQIEKRLKELNHKAQDYERLQKKIIHFAVTDAIKYEGMWLTLDAEVKELLQRALAVDSLIYEQVLHLPWERPCLSFMETGKWEERSAISQAPRCCQTDADNVNVSVKGFEKESDPEAGVGSTAEDSGTMSQRTAKKLMELFCDEAAFLLEVKVVKMLDSLEENEQTLVKMGYLFNTLGIEEKDVPKLVDFLHKYGQQDAKESEDDEVAESSNNTDGVETCSTAPVTPDPINRSDVLPALKCFLDRYKRGSKNPEQWSLQSLDVRDMSKEKAYWKSMGNVISSDKLRIWEATESALKRHHAVLSEISELSLEIQSLQQKNTELQMVCMFLQQVGMDQPLSLNPGVTQLQTE